MWVPQAHLADRQFLQFLSLSKVLRCGTKKEKGAEEEGWGCLIQKPNINIVGLKSEICTR